MKRLLIVLSIIMLSYASDVVQKSGTCLINWTQAYIECRGFSETGQTKYQAFIAAKVIAQRDMLEFIQGVRIDSTTTVKDEIVQSDVIKTSVSGVVRGARVVDSRYNQDGSAEVTLRIALYKDLLKALLQITNKISMENDSILRKILSPFLLYADTLYLPQEIDTLKKLRKDFLAKNNLQAVKYLDIILNKMKSQHYTGVIIDASGVDNFEISMLPKIRLTNGKEIYPANYLHAKVATSKGAAQYIDGIEDAIKSKRVTNNPLYLKANKIYGKRYSDLVLDSYSQKLLKQVDPIIFQKARIVILVEK